MQMVLKSWFLIFLSGLLSGSNFHETEKSSPIGADKYSSSQCTAVMTYLSRIWNMRDGYCQNNKSIIGLQIKNLINDNGCFIGQPFSLIRKYLGVPDMIGNHEFVYKILYDKQADENRTGALPSAINFEISKDSLIEGITIMKMLRDE